MTNEEIDQSGIGILPFFSQELGKEFMTNNLTSFQQELIYVARELIEADRHFDLAFYKEAKAKFMELVKRAIDKDKPRKFGDDGIWVRVDD